MIWIVLMLMPSLVSAIMITSKKPQSRTILKKKGGFIVTPDLESAFLK